MRDGSGQAFGACPQQAAAFGFDAHCLDDRLRRPSLPATQLLADEGKAARRLGARTAPPSAR